jgi:hypothetical protein
MTEYSVSITENNPFRKLQRADGTASARAMLNTGCFHTRWANLNAAVIRARDEFAGHFGEAAAQHEFHSTMKRITRRMPNGGTSTEEVPDWDLTPVAQLYTCLKCDLPNTNLWFVTTGLEKLGAPAMEATREVPPPEMPAPPPLDLTEMAVAAGMGIQAYTSADGRVFPFYPGAAEDARKMLALLWQREDARADAVTVAAIAAAPEPVIPMPVKKEFERRKLHFNSGRGTWVQAEEAVKNMLWNAEPPAGLDFHMYFEAARRKADANLGVIDRPGWDLLVLLSNNLRTRIGDAAGGWQAPALP